MYAIVKSGGRQLRVTPNTTVKVDRLPSVVGDPVEFTEVLAVHNGSELTVGTPHVDGAKVVGRIVAQGKDPKIRVNTYRAKKRTRRHKGHRQHHTMVQILEIAAQQLEGIDVEEESQPPVEEPEADEGVEATDVAEDGGDDTTDEE